MLLGVVVISSPGMMVLAQSSGNQTTPGQFPFFRSFLDGELEYISFPPAYNNAGANRVNTASSQNLTSEGLILTDGKSQVGVFYLPEHTFSTTDGFQIEFEYVMYGSNNLTDGICMFLVDADYASDLKFGAEGSGFGYTYKRASVAASQVYGIEGAYLAVALDQGPFKSQRMELTEMRNGIVYNDDPNYTTNVQPLRHDTRSNITIRGAAGNVARNITVNGGSNTFSGLNPAYWGYPVLITRHTGWNPETGSTGQENETGFILNTSTGIFQQHVTPFIPQPFNIAGGENNNTNPGDPGYRKMIIKLEPNPDLLVGGFKISVIIQHGLQETLVIENFTYPSTVNYLENCLPRSITQDAPTVFPNYNPPVGYTVPIPDELVIGFAASTGTATAYTNIIRNLSITPMYASNATNDNVLSHRRGPVTIMPFENDLAYKSQSGSIIGSKDNIDPTKFRFWLNEYNVLKDGSENAIWEYTVTGKGKWVYKPDTRQVIFFPVKGFTGTVEIFYDILGLYSPFNDEKYRSAIAKISVTIDNNQPII